MKKIMILLYLFFQFFALEMHSVEYIYPVGTVDDENLLLMRQTSLDDLELWMWNTKELVTFKELNSIFLPSSVQVLPNKKACSFIDRGRIKIKYFNKRTPRVITFVEPIYGVSNITWVNDEQFYFAGKHDDCFKLFLCDISNRNNTIFCLSNLKDPINYLYPQKVNDELFCIAKNFNDDNLQHYAIFKMKWNPQDYQIRLEQKTSTILGSFETFTPLIDSDQPLCFLVMQGENHGFCLKFLQNENIESSFFCFCCCKVERSADDTWTCTNLFNFQLPKNLLIGSGPERIYESIYPFLPMYTQTSIYFVNFNHTSQTCQIARYDQASGAIQATDPYGSRSINSSSHLFAPCIINNSIYCGMSVSASMPNRNIALTEPIPGVFRCQLPKLDFENN